MEIGGAKYNNEKMFDVIANSDYAHLDDDKSSVIENLGEMGQLLAREQFLAYIHIGVWTIVELRHVLNEMLKDSDTESDD